MPQRTDRSDPQQKLPTGWDAEHPWHRQPCDVSHTENRDLPWWAFLYFRDTIPRPTYPQISDYLERWCRIRVAPARIRRWARKNMWHDRVMALDRAMCRKVDQDRYDYLAENSTEVARRHLELIRNGLDYASEQLDRLLDQAESDPTPQASIRELARVTKDLVQLERLIRGDTTERTEVRPDLSRLTSEELRRLSAIRSKLENG